MFYCYLHLRPDGTCFHVGKGLFKRCFEFRANRNPFYRNIVRKYGMDNIIVSTITCDSEREALDLEIAMIAEFKKQGVILTNMTDGGEGVSGFKHSEEHRRSLRKRMVGNAYAKGRVLTEEHKRKIGLASKGRTVKFSEEARQNMSIAQKARVLSEDAKARISAGALK